MFRDYDLVRVCLSLICVFSYAGFVCFYLGMSVCLPVYKCMLLWQWPVYLCLFFCIYLLVFMFKCICVFLFCCSLYVPLSVIACVLISEHVLFCCCLCVFLCVLDSVLINESVCVCEGNCVCVYTFILSGLVWKSMYVCACLWPFISVCIRHLLTACASITAFVNITMCQFVYARVDMCVHLYAAASMCVCEAHILSVSMHVLLRDGLCAYDSVHVHFLLVRICICAGVFHFLNVDFWLISDLRWWEHVVWYCASITHTHII